METRDCHEADQLSGVVMLCGGRLIGGTYEREQVSKPTQGMLVSDARASICLDWGRERSEVFMDLIASYVGSVHACNRNSRQATLPIL